jgi:AP-1 complex subunit beta-1
MYLKLEGEAEDLVTQVLTQATEESDNPDLRNRGYIYWRMLSQDPEEAKALILCEKPVISEDSGHLEPQLLDKLIDNISMLSSVYYKPPEAFVKKIRDRINERLDIETDEVNQGNDDDYEDSMGVKKSEYIKQAQEPNNLYSDAIGDLLGMGNDDKPATQMQVNEGQGGGGNDLLDLMGEGK